MYWRIFSCSSMWACFRFIVAVVNSRSWSDQLFCSIVTDLRNKQVDPERNFGVSPAVSVSVPPWPFQTLDQITLVGPKIRRQQRLDKVLIQFISGWGHPLHALSGPSDGYASNWDMSPYIFFLLCLSTTFSSPFRAHRVFYPSWQEINFGPR